MLPDLHVRSAFSFLRGASSPAALAREAARLGLSAVALCDRDGVYGAPRFHAAAREAGLRPVVGAEVTLADGTVLPLLAESRQGYRNLCRLITTARLEPRPGARPAGLEEEAEPDGRDPGQDETRPLPRKRPCLATWDEVEAHRAGLIALTGDEEGPVQTALRAGGPGAARRVLARLRGLFGPDHLAVEVQRFRVRGELRTLETLAALADDAGLPLVATGGACHATREERPLADVFTCLRHHTTLDAAGRLLSPNAERHLRSPGVLNGLFAPRPDALENACRISERLSFTLSDLGYRFPEFPVPPGHDMASFLRERTLEGARARFPRLSPAVLSQLRRELALIEKLGFCGYFLIVWDICRWARDRGILVQGRGSAANSAVCFALSITAVDPIERRLLFERFLSEGRVGADGRPSWPDIDLDLPSGELREEVIREVYRRYGPRGAAMTANVITYRGRSTTRELGKVLGLPEDVMDRFSRLYAGGDYPSTLGLEDQIRQAGLPDRHPRLPVLIDLHRRLHGLPRHLGQHSGGMVVCAGSLDGIVPLEPASMEGRVVVQWDKDDCEDLGIVKIDFLGLGMMAVLQDTLRLCAESGRGPRSLTDIPHDDPGTFAALQRADTVGVFQVESRAQMVTLRRFKPATFYDVAIQVAIVRPGPIVGKLIHPLLRRRQGREPVTFLHPSVEDQVRPLLERTYGVVLYQEQMLALAMVLGGFTGAEAEELRRGMGFQRDNERLQRVLARLRASMQARGHPEDLVAQVSEAACNFALYGFPESHAISFALLAYASAWLKVHRPAEFLACLLNHQPMGFYAPATLVQDARRHGLRTLPACVAASEWDCTVEHDGAVRLGLRYVRGVREAAVRSMLESRRTRPFASMDDWLGRTAFTAAERRALACVGALRPLAPHRRAALWQVEAAWTTDEPLLLGLALDGAEAPLPPMAVAERHAADFSTLGLTTGPHPMASVRHRLEGVWTAAELPLAKDGERVLVAGAVICRQRPGTAKGVVFVSLEDETGVANAIVRPALFERCRLVINEEPALRIGGRLQNVEGVIHIQAEAIEPLLDTPLPGGASHDFH